MIEAVLTVCLLADPKNCHDERHKLLDEDITIMQCLMGMLPNLAPWQAAHPGWRIESFTCRIYTPEKDA